MVIPNFRLTVWHSCMRRDDELVHLLYLRTIFRVSMPNFRLNAWHWSWCGAMMNSKSKYMKHCGQGIGPGSHMRWWYSYSKVLHYTSVFNFHSAFSLVLQCTVQNPMNEPHIPACRLQCNDWPIQPLNNPSWSLVFHTSIGWARTNEPLL